MPWRWSFYGHRRNDFMPILLGGAMLLTSLPAFVMLLVYPDQGAGELVVFLLFLLGTGNLLGVAFIALGVRICSYPGSLAYRITHGRILR